MGGAKCGAQQLFASAAAPVPLHSPTWYSCINSLFPWLSHHWERQCAPLFHRHILSSQLPHQPQDPSHVSVTHDLASESALLLAQFRFFLCLHISCHFPMQKGKTNRAQWGPEPSVSLVVHISPLTMKDEFINHTHPNKAPAFRPTKQMLPG